MLCWTNHFVSTEESSDISCWCSAWVLAQPKYSLRSGFEPPTQSQSVTTTAALLFWWEAPKMATDIWTGRSASAVPDSKTNVTARQKKKKKRSILTCLNMTPNTQATSRLHILSAGIFQFWEINLTVNKISMSGQICFETSISSLR